MSSIQFVRVLLAHNSPKCFIEGTRSRTGKLLPPKLGILKYVLETFQAGRTDDVWICPISIQYDKVLETESYLNESVLLFPILHDWLLTATSPSQAARQPEREGVLNRASPQHPRHPTQARSHRRSVPKALFAQGLRGGADSPASGEAPQHARDGDEPEAGADRPSSFPWVSGPFGHQQGRCYHASTLLFSFSSTRSAAGNFPFSVLKRTTRRRL